MILIIIIYFCQKWFLQLQWKFGDSRETVSEIKYDKIVREYNNKVGGVTCILWGEGWGEASLVARFWRGLKCQNMN